MTADIENAKMFMICSFPNEGAAKSLPRGYHFQRIRPGELDAWKRMPERELYPATMIEPTFGMPRKASPTDG